MKKIFTLFTLCTLHFALCTSLCAQTTVLVLNDTAEYTLNAGGTKGGFVLNKPCSRLRIQAKHEANQNGTGVSGKFYVDQKIGNDWQTIYTGYPGVVTTAEKTVLFVPVTYEASVAYEDIVLDLDRRATEVRFKSDLIGNKKYIRNVRAEMASFIELSPANMDFGELVVRDEAKTLPMVVTYCNVAPLTVSSTNPDFVLSKSSVATGLGVYAKDTVSVTFSPIIRGEHTSTIVVTNGAQTDSIHCRAKVVKRTPVFSQEATTMSVGDEVSELISSDCDNRLMLESCNSDIITVDCGVVKAVAPGVATVTAMQLGDDDYWNNKVETYTVQVIDPTSTSAAAIRTTTSTAKTIRNGMVYVEANDNMYHINGQQQ